jgi:hypothetical protein
MRAKPLVVCLVSLSVSVFVLVLMCCPSAFALTPEISSIDPDHGARGSPTDVTISGNNFESTPFPIPPSFFPHPLLFQYFFSTFWRFSSRPRIYTIHSSLSRC